MGNQLIKSTKINHYSIQEIIRVNSINYTIKDSNKLTILDFEIKFYNTDLDALEEYKKNG